MSGALTTAAIVALSALVAWRPLVPRRSAPFTLQHALGWWVNEVPFLGACWLAAGTLGALSHPEPGVWWWVVLAVTVAAVLLLARLAVRARSARPALAAALQDVYGPRARPRRTRLPWWRTLVPFVARRPDVRRVRNRRYGPARLGNRLDVYVSRRTGQSGGPAPVLVYFHAAFSSKMLGSQPLIHRLAAHGWVCVSAGRRQLGVDHRAQLADVRAALDWVRENVAAYGGDPGRMIAVGGSAGANLAVTATMTDGGVAGLVGLYGYYGDFGDPGAASPHRAIHRDAPPTLLIHGALDTLVPAREARAFADRLRRTSAQPVVHAELPGAHHSFDVFPSIRSRAVDDAIVRFADLTVTGDPAPRPPGPAS
ncbi:alpha/beta hydrolase [Isoptericola sp. b515]|uniref:alpha/beta hydrolase n=1 Tax=Isoptericola sp. b515 TaxID=3064652 RepID=UPI00271252CD|nr:alpha/beta hydrolase [Isoptericola sp. b515]MDO8147632.1 alpha/beta hydrolase [Isoptericola sp. b515]